MTIVLYPGSFDPITYGHLDVIRRASRLFEHVHIGVIHNPSKSSTFSLDERLHMIRAVIADSIDNVTVHAYTGLLVDFAHAIGVSAIVRGLRAISDFEFEFQLSLTNRQLSPQLETILLMTDSKYSYISSTAIKQIAMYGGDVSSFVPPLVEQQLKERL